ncbi:MAG: bifunctional 5,10-methylene-tetrahydrofolate dehydrogenase/5,10-methylene-tetrahydrofolate cyclohydrolase [Lachnospiraceae bacterium]|nr:bifunctional 5,10-methylene-tetrahydrofolate dehydrogenase/5,10-methylene-tetrahydrofolate cyclohydrolase [Lachnospiraceae bacterium]
MSAEVLKGIDVAKAINEGIIEKVKNLDGYIPRLAIIRVGERADDIAYEKGAVKKMEKLGLEYTLNTFPDDITNERFQSEFDRINRDNEIDGILLLRPLPKHIDEEAVCARIDPFKDMDGISPINMAKVYAGDESGYAPCTAEAVIETLNHAGIDLTGKNVTVVGRSLVIGKPAAMLLIKRNATVTICHTRTKNIEEKCRNAEILIAAAGSKKMIKSGFVSEGAVVIDVGINDDGNGGICGDVDFDAVAGKASLITPVPGGVGSVTTSVLAKHLLRAAHIR